MDLLGALKIRGFLGSWKVGSVADSSENMQVLVQKVGSIATSVVVRVGMQRGDVA